MNAAAVQLSFEAEGLDPHELAGIPILERAALYDTLGLDRLQRQAVEEALRAVLAGQYRRAYKKRVR
jgi:hypothetical protein